jgi:hypothetical protein
MERRCHAGSQGRVSRAATGIPAILKIVPIGEMGSLANVAWRRLTPRSNGLHILFIQH